MLARISTQPLILAAHRFANLMKRRQIREALGSEREALLSQLTEQMVSLRDLEAEAAAVETCLVSASVGHIPRGWKGEGGHKGKSLL